MVKRIKIRSKKETRTGEALVSEKVMGAGPVRMAVMEYDEATSTEREIKTASELVPPKDWPGVTWYDIDGVHDHKLVETVCDNFGIHPVVCKDMMNTDQRPKAEDLDDYIYMNLKMLYLDKNEIIIEQVALILGKNYVITMQERMGDVFEPIRERIRSGKGKLRKMGPDYLAYKLIDSIIDNYFVILDKLREKIEDIEEDVVVNPTPQMLQIIHLLKKELIFLRKTVWPVRDLLSDLMNCESTLVKDTTSIYLKDANDHVIRVVDTIEIIHDMVSDILDIYLSSISYRTNSVMKVLTVIATIFIPLTFIVGIYGMNFKYMPELNTAWGYPMVLAICFTVSGVMLSYFWRKHWL